MSTTRPMTKSPRALAREALRLAQEALPAYSSKFSRKDFTQHQLFALLALKTFFKTDSRGLVQLLKDFGELREELGLDSCQGTSILAQLGTRTVTHRAGDSRLPPRKRTGGLVGGVFFRPRPRRTRRILVRVTCMTCQRVSRQTLGPNHLVAKSVPGPPSGRGSSWCPPLPLLKRERRERERRGGEEGGTISWAMDKVNISWHTKCITLLERPRQPPKTRKPHPLQENGPESPA